MTHFLEVTPIEDVAKNKNLKTTKPFGDADYFVIDGRCYLPKSFVFVEFDGTISFSVAEHEVWKDADGKSFVTLN